MSESWVTAPQTEEQTAYLQAEAVYRNFVYENYMAVNRNLTELMDVLFHAEEPDSDSTFSVLTHIREVLRTRCRYEAAGVEASADADPIAYFLNQSYRGNAALFAATAVEALRSYGIPARYAEGYRCTEEKLAASRGDTLALTGQDRHAWVEVYYDGIGWIAVDVTPGYYYDLVSLQRLVNLPNDVTKTADLSKNDTRADENSESDNPSSGGCPTGADREASLGQAAVGAGGRGFAGGGAGPVGRAAAGNPASAIAPQLPESRCPGAGQAGGEGTLCRADCQGHAGWVGLEHGAAGRLAG